MSKIQIWKRITTGADPQAAPPELYLICQRYKFESESQPLLLIYPLSYAVFNMSKIQIWKRITTTQTATQHAKQLYLICQRYKFESESQLGCFYTWLWCAVFNMSKIQIWKRITTPLHRYSGKRRLYLICQRYKFESDSQRWGANFG